MEIGFSHPTSLWGLLLVPALVILYFASLKYSKSTALKFANFAALSRASGGKWSLSGFNVLAIRMVALICIVLAISGMTLWFIGESANRDYVFVIDASASMVQQDSDFNPTRLESAKQSAAKFVDSAPLNSRVGVISFAGTNFVDQYLTEDKVAAKDAILAIEPISVGGTDFANAIISACNLLIPSIKARDIILITDGRDNLGVSEERAVLYAIENHVVVNTIGIGSMNPEDEFSLGVDEEALKEIALLTLGNYYRVENSADLDSVYFEIIKNPPVGKNPFELFYYLWAFAVVLLITEWILGATVYRRIS